MANDGVVHELSGWSLLVTSNRLGYRLGIDHGDQNGTFEIKTKNGLYRYILGTRSDRLTPKQLPITGGVDMLHFQSLSVISIS